MIVLVGNKVHTPKTKSSLFTAVKMIEPWAKFNVRVLSVDESIGLAYGSGSYREGTKVQIWAEAKAGYKFIRWSDGSTESSRTITANEDIELIAYFEKDMTKGILTYYPNKEYMNPRQ